MNDHYPPFELAAYFDGALPGPDADAVEVHLHACAVCRSRIAAMSGARRAVELLPLPSVPKRVWGRVDRRLEPTRPPRSMADSRPPRRRGDDPVRRGRGTVPDAAAASFNWRWSAAVVVVLALGWVLVASPLGSRLAAAVQPQGIDYGGYLAGLTDPEAMERFESDYERRRLPIRSGGSLAGALVGEDLLAPPAGLVPRTAFALSDDGIRAVEVTYVRGRSLIEVFRQPAHHPARLDGFSPRKVDIGGVPALLVDGSTHRIVTFTSVSDRYVIVARRDESDLSEIVRAFAKGS